MTGLTDQSQSDEVLAPEGWERCTLGELGAFSNGINKPKEAFGSGHPFVNLMDVFGVPEIGSVDDCGLVVSTESEKARYNLVCGDVLFVRSSVKPSGVGLTTLVANDLSNAVFSGFLLRFRNSDSLNVQFKRYCFQAGYFRSALIASSTVSANTNINQSALKRLSIIFPSSKDEQRRIAQALRDIDELIASLDALIAKKSDIKQAAVQQLLTGKTRLPEFGADWQVYSFASLFTFLKNGNNSRSDLSADGDVRYVHYGDIHACASPRMSAMDLPTIAASKVAGLPRVQNGDLIFADASEDYAGVGKSVEMVDCEGREVVAGLHTILARGNSQLLADGFKGYIQMLPEVRSALIRIANGISVYGISKTGIRPIEIRLPAKGEQAEIASLLMDMDAELEQLAVKRSKAASLKEGMMQQLLTGRIRLA